MKKKLVFLEFWKAVPGSQINPCSRLEKDGTTKYPKKYLNTEYLKKLLFNLKTLEFFDILIDIPVQIFFFSIFFFLCK